MSAIFRQQGKTIPYANPGLAAIAYQAVIDLGTRIVVAVEAIAVGATGSVATEGVFEFDAVNNAAFSVGQEVYWDPATSTVTDQGAGLTPAGWVVETKLLAGTTARVKIG
jgi:predicted RecA/RadA family phage recombinase